MPDTEVQFNKQCQLLYTNITFNFFLSVTYNWKVIGYMAKASNKFLHTPELFSSFSFKYLL